MRFLSFLALPNASLGLKSIQEWRVHVLKGILRGVIVLWVIALLGGVRNALVTYQNESASTPNARLLLILVLTVYAVATWLLAFITFSKSVSYHAQVGGLLTAIYLVGTVGLYFSSLSGDGRIIIFTFIILSAIFLEPFYGFLAFCIGMATMILVGWLQVTGIVVVPLARQVNSTDTGAWVSGISVFLSLSVAVLISVTYLLQVLGLNLKRSVEQAEELAQAYDVTLEGWARALELRDELTEGHTRRVTEMTLKLARLLKLSDADLVQIRRGAFLHDIGKMGIPDAILHKPGPLTDEERNIIEQHTQYAYDMLSKIPFLQDAIDIPYCHHEHWDGHGYPRGLKGEGIPLFARIFAVVDVWDALTSDRPYRRAWKKAEARQYILDRAGTQFDPRMVEVFLLFINNEEDV
ncbi:MAG: HD-GYP domain-containing protein [Anaerolineales bacterium]|uniref:HD-GYP domain-containing protein n=1 Tax=Candidatus Villigracilis vicinus TaxID=3140679 RepID=UPI003136642A|nr:HD-GYP domain-containing protein [Anaerolineales bacterium]